MGVLCSHILCFTDSYIAVTHTALTVLLCNLDFCRGHILGCGAPRSSVTQTLGTLLTPRGIVVPQWMCSGVVKKEKAKGVLGWISRGIEYKKGQWLHGWPTQHSRLKTQGKVRLILTGKEEPSWMFSDCQSMRLVCGAETLFEKNRPHFPAVYFFPLRAK